MTTKRSAAQAPAPERAMEDKELDRWLQARRVTLVYNGVKANTIHWERWEIDGAIDPALFTPPR